ncbi:MAG: TolC family outer membrane protein [Gammaproteobacteria bacterium]|nr:TolC family outer membrane protein [Gammaproteobacteria bacterium]
MLVAVVSTTGGLSAHAENLMDIFRLATQNDPQLLAAQAERDMQYQNKQQAVSAFLPRITFNAGGTRTKKDYEGQPYSYPVYQYISPTQTIETNYRAYWDPTYTALYNTHYLNLQLYQPILDMGVIAGYQLASHTLLHAELAYRIAQQDMLMRVADRYLYTLLAGSTLHLARAEKNAISLQLEASKHKYDVGLIAVTDVHEVKARYDHAIAQEIMAENALAAAREELREITGVLHNSLLVLKPDAPLIPPSPTNIDTWTTAATTQNLRVRATEHALEAAQMAVQRERAAYYPTLGLTASIGRTGSDQAYAGYSATDTVVGVDFSMNLFQGGFTHSRIVQAQRNVDKTLQELEKQRREASKLTRNAFLGVLAGISHVTALRQAVQSNESAHKSSIAGFEVGARTSIEVLNAQQELYRSQREHAYARIEYILNTLRLKLNVGMLTVDDLEQINAWLG